MASTKDHNPYLDVSQLEPPEPMTVILDTLEKLPTGHFLTVYHRREPFPLYNLLQNMKMKWQTYCDNDGMFYIHIWPDGDMTAEERALTLIQQQK